MHRRREAYHTFRNKYYPNHHDRRHDRRHNQKEHRRKDDHRYYQYRKRQSFHTPYAKNFLAQSSGTILETISRKCSSVFYYTLSANNVKGL